MNTFKPALNLSEMVRIRTVSHDNPQETDWKAFESFKSLLETLYPLVHKRCERTFHDKTGILYKWPGAIHDTHTTVLMAHYDVVPAEDDLWTVNPFSGDLKDNSIWGRGTLDTKCTLCGILEAVETLLSEGFSPQYDLYLSFSGDEEIGGPSAPAIVEFFKQNGIRPFLVIDEGGIIIDGKLFNIDKPIALIGTGEKGYLDLALTLSGPGGHSSFPPPHSLVGDLSAAVVKLEKSPLDARLIASISELLQVIGMNSRGLSKFFLTNLWLTWPLVRWLFTKKGGKLNALIRTTTAVTRMTGSDAYNVMPPMVTLGINFRLFEGDTIQSVIDHTLTTISNPSIQCKVIKGWEASPIASTSHEGWHRVKSVILENWPSVAVAPYLMLGGTDSRHFCSISECVLRFSPFHVTDEQIDSIHGHNEHITVPQLNQCIDFYKRIITLS